jgi:hypothetical protein
VTIGWYKNEIRVGVRQYKTKDVDVNTPCPGYVLQPSQPGISLPLNQWDQLKIAMPDVNEALKQKASLNFAIGGDRSVFTSCYDRNNQMYVHIRNHFTNKAGNVAPGKYGISLRLDEWETLFHMVDDIENAIKMMSSDIKVDGKTIIKTVFMYFSEVPCWQYCILETGDVFYSKSEDPVTAYNEYERDSLQNQPN